MTAEELFEATIVNSPERRALLLIAGETFDPWSRRVATEALAEVVGSQLGDAIALQVAVDR